MIRTASLIIVMAGYAGIATADYAGGNVKSAIASAMLVAVNGILFSP